MTVEVIMTTPEHLIGEMAKICYATKQLEDGGKDITSTIVHDYKHLASLRFAYATVTLEGISVACQNQIVRSSHLSFMVQSKRYVSADKGEFQFIMPENISSSHQWVLKENWDNSIALYQSLLATGMKKEDARAILPANTSTKMNISGNLQGWLSFFKLRLSSKAQTEIRNVAKEIWNQLALHFPLVLTDNLYKEYTECKH